MAMGPPTGPGVSRQLPASTSEAGPSRSIALPVHPAPPRPILTTDQAVAEWHTTPGFRGFWGWITHRCDRIVGKEILHGKSGIPAVDSWMDLLDQMTAWVEEAPTKPQSNQRFGNLAFRDYSKLVEQRLPGLVERFPGIPPQLAGQIIPLLINSTAFGQPTRLDYGTGHELAFVLALWCCVVAGLIGGEGKEDEEDQLVLRVFPRYLELVTLLQKTYRLEPAGSHGVWGLDDYCFFPYLFGSAQLLGSNITPGQALQNATESSSPITDMYTLSLQRITLFKSGAAFSEHSPLLHQLSTFPDWKKPHGGLRKMFMGEVAGKRVVVQGIWAGGWVWGENMPREVGSDEKEERAGGAGMTGMPPTGVPVVTAPWAGQTDRRAQTLAAANAGWGTVPPRR